MLRNHASLTNGSMRLTTNCQSDQTKRSIRSIIGIFLSSQQDVSETTICNVPNSKNTPSVKSDSWKPWQICWVDSGWSDQTFFNAWRCCPRIGVMAKNNLLNSLWLGSLFNDHRLEFCNNCWRLIVAIVSKQIHGFNQGIVVRTYENHFSHDSNGRTNVNFMLSEDRTMSTGNVLCQKLKEILTMTFGCFRCQITRKARIMCEICNPALLLFFDAM